MKLLLRDNYGNKVLHKKFMAKTKMEIIKKFCSITPRTQEMITEIMAAKGHMTFSEYVRSATEKYYEDLIKGNMYQAKGDSSKRMKEKNRELADAQEQQDICTALGGTVQTNPDGSKVCVYFTYFGRKRYEQKMSFTMLNREMINTQYQPSKEKVEQLQKEGKAEY